MSAQTPTADSAASPNLSRAKRALWAVIAVYIALVATHEGEFWPFSIYPMFSQAGKPWTRAVVMELDEQQFEQLQWAPVSREQLPGTPFSTKAVGVDAIDLAKFVTMTTHWDEPTIVSLRKMMGPEQRSKRLLFVKVHGRLGDSENRVDLRFEPVVAIGPDRALVSPNAS